VRAEIRPGWFALFLDDLVYLALNNDFQLFRGAVRHVLAGQGDFHLGLVDDLFTDDLTVLADQALLLGCQPAVYGEIPEIKIALLDAPGARNTNFSQVGVFR
jgi:hypothetical protein